MRETPHEEAASETPEIIDVEPEETPDDTEEDMRDSEHDEQELEAAMETLLEEPEPSRQTRNEAPSEETQSEPEARTVKRQLSTRIPVTQNSGAGSAAGTDSKIEIITFARAVMGTDSMRHDRMVMSLGSRHPPVNG